MKTMVSGLSSLPYLGPPRFHSSSVSASLSPCGGRMARVHPSSLHLQWKEFLPPRTSAKVLAFTEADPSGVTSPVTRGVRGVSRSSERKQDGSGRNSSSSRSLYSSPALPLTVCRWAASTPVLWEQSFPHSKCWGGVGKVMGMKSTLKTWPYK